MPLAEIVGEALGAVVRFIGRHFAEGAIELLAHGTGRAVLNVFRPGREYSDETIQLVGMVTWVVLVALTSGGLWWLL